MKINLLIFALVIFAAGAIFLFVAGSNPFLKARNELPKAGQNSNQDNTGNVDKDSQIEMTISSPVFIHNGGLVISATCAGQGVNPPLDIRGVPKSAKSLALIFEDPDAPSGTFYHWILWNIKPSTKIIEENSVPDGAVEGINSDRRFSYVAACPPSGTHRYTFNLYALDVVLDLPSPTTALDLEHAMEGHVIDQAHITALYR